MNAKCVKLNAQNEFECTNYGISKVTKPYRAKLNDQIAKIVTFSWFGMKSMYFRMMKTLIWKLAKWIRKADEHRSAKIVEFECKENTIDW